MPGGHHDEKQRGWKVTGRARPIFKRLSRKGSFFKEIFKCNEGASRVDWLSGQSFPGTENTEPRAVKEWQEVSVAAAE